MLQSPNPATPASARRPWRRLHAALMPGYDARATACWSGLVLLGGLVLLQALVALAPWPATTLALVLAGCAAAGLAALRPVRLPGTADTVAAGELPVLLLLVTLGPPAATLAAAAAAGVAAVRRSRRWTSRLAGPAVAAVSTGLAGWAYQAVAGGLTADNVVAQALALVLAVGCALGRCALGAALDSALVYLKSRQPLRPQALLANVGPLGASHALGALAAGLLAGLLRLVP